MALAELRDEIWASLEDLQPFNAAGYVVGQRPSDPAAHGGTGWILTGLFDSLEAAHAWGNAHAGDGYGYVVSVVWQP